ncbi:hypothetical protein CLAIMM_04565 [Cladophialophora immunda]|nr:hypothetical protein CLAIMM_04565 [Cladophialophora immunda]
MPATNLRGRFDRSKIAPLKAGRSESSHGVEEPELVQRQALPENDFLPRDQTSSDDDSQDEDEGDDADDSSGEGDDSDHPNPSQPATATASQGQASLTAPTKTTNHPSTAHSTIGSSATPTSTDIGANGSQGFLPTTSAFPSSFTTSSTSVVPPPNSSTGLAAPVSTSPVATSESVSASDHPLSKVAIIVPSLLGAVAAIVAAYLLFRYCNPLKARWAVYRARKGNRLPGEEEDGTAPKAAPQMTEAYTTRTEIAHPPSLHISPLATTRRAPPPPLVRNGSMNNLGHIAVANQHARSQSNPQTLPDNTPRPPSYASGGYGARALQLQAEEEEEEEEDAGLPNPDPPFRHPNGLANNPPTPVARNRPPTPRQRHEAVSDVPSMPSPSSVAAGGLDLEFPLPPSTPSGAAHFSTTSPPPGSTFSSPHRLHKSITPSESISNVPDSPFPFSPALMPPMPLLNSRWSHNSSSVNGRTALGEERRTAQRHSADPGLVDAAFPAPRSPSPKNSSLSLASPPS